MVDVFAHDDISSSGLEGRENIKKEYSENFSDQLVNFFSDEPFTFALPRGRILKEKVDKAREDGSFSRAGESLIEKLLRSGELKLSKSASSENDDNIEENTTVYSVCEDEPELVRSFFDTKNAKKITRVQKDNIGEKSYSFSVINPRVPGFANVRARGGADEGEGTILVFENFRENYITLQVFSYQKKPFFQNQCQDNCKSSFYYSFS